MLSGTAAFGSWHDDAPGKRRHITADALPPPYASPSAGNTVRVVRAPAGAQLKVPAGFEVKPFASGLSGPRLLRTAPNGDIFVAETGAGRVRVLRPGENGAAAGQNEIFASGLHGPFGIAFYPAGQSRMGLCGQYGFGGPLRLSGRRHEGARRARDHRGRAAFRPRPFDPRRGVLEGRRQNVRLRRLGLQ